MRSIYYLKTEYITEQQANNSTISSNRGVTLWINHKRRQARSCGEEMSELTNAVLPKKRLDPISSIRAFMNTAEEMADHIEAIRTSDKGMSIFKKRFNAEYIDTGIKETKLWGVPVYIDKILSGPIALLDFASTRGVLINLETGDAREIRYSRYDLNPNNQ